LILQTEGTGFENRNKISQSITVIQYGIMTLFVCCSTCYLFYESQCQLYELFTRMVVYSKSYVADGDLVEENLLNLNDPVEDLNMVSTS
jgi:hypothetical protein